ncbi:MAG: OmpA family protein [bacterium]|nr:OmpA family protein [bacterium]MDT8366520.1 OmpA family protein [bacterium]
MLYGKSSLTVFVLVLVAAIMFAWVPGSRAEDGDHPLIKRYPGSKGGKSFVRDFDEVQMPTGKSGRDGFADTITVKGKATGIVYQNPKKRSTLEIYQNYEEAMKAGGFEFLFTCADKECGKPGPEDPMLNYRWACFEQRHATARLARPEGDIFVNLHVCKGTDKTFLGIVESKPMETGLVKVDADALADEIDRTGHASIYGIYFDTDKADVKPESEQALGEIAKLLAQRPDLNLYVVGHTDSVGSLDYNRDLSVRRARAVVEVLTVKYGIAKSRLRGEGVGPLVPVLANSSDGGRAKNRRVELVKQ